MNPTTANVFDIYALYKDVFRGNFHVPNTQAKDNDVFYSGIPQNENPRGTIHYSKKGQSFNKQGLYGQNIWFPIELKGHEVMEGGTLREIVLPIDICTVSVNLVSTIVSTPVVERKGTVNEIVNIDDYKFTIRGFLVGENRKFPEQQLLDLVALKESTEEKSLHGGYPELFLDETCRIVISELEWPEVQGQVPWMKPFTLICKSDFITDLIFL